MIPVFVPFGMLIDYKERISAMNIVGGLVSLIGIAIMIMGSGTNISSELRDIIRMFVDNSFSSLSNGFCTLKGILLLFTAVLITVFYSLILRKIVDKYPPVTITVYQNIIGIF